MKKIISSCIKGAKLYINPDLHKPKSARLIITQNCCLKCKMCSFWKERSPEPSLELIKYWIKELAEFGIKDVDIGGGEPFIIKTLPEIVKEIKSYGMECGITTSGWLIDKVPFPPVDRCEVSIDGATPEIHDKVRGLEGSWQRAVDAVKSIKKHCRVSQINFTLQADNYHEVVDFCKLAKELGAPASIIPISLKLSAQEKLADEMNEYDLPKLKELIDEAYKVGNVITPRHVLDTFLKKVEHGPCNQPCMTTYNGILIFADGNLYPCGNLDLPLGNLNFRTQLKDIYKNSRNLRRKIMSGKHERCSWCTYPDIISRETLRSSFKEMIGFKK
jgi:MoaA/NifB/PqqE/SkfB family radical SAM enzyme